MGASTGKIAVLYRYFVVRLRRLDTRRRYVRVKAACLSSSSNRLGPGDGGRV